MPFALKPPIYTLPHGIEVIGEYAPNKKCPYWRVRVRPHPLLAGVNVYGGVCLRKSRVLMTAHLGRKLLTSEIVHHRNDDKTDDRVDNFDLVDAGEHNRHHKTGTTRGPESRSRTSASLKTAYRTGRRQPTGIANRDHKGRIAK